ncbi:hypothetical protein HK103_004564 [Boothiomyces macroporosus]|uniref:Uncharacterized protein n=1 Tax=Boothiomyces macroporosus TaxID=261099 RepID=A0AAD5UGW3_9FUNG|nr:hypothetical protein HK103_004564 [Boothiomyces macroporosus]
MAVFYSLSLLILGYTLSNCKFWGGNAGGILNVLILTTIAAQSLYITSLLVLASGVESGQALPIQILGNLCDIVNTCCLEFAYIIRLKVCIGNKQEQKFTNLLWVYPVIYPIADIVSIVGYFNHGMADISTFAWTITNIGLLVQESIVHGWFFKEMICLCKIDKNSRSFWWMITIQLVYMFGFLGSLTCSMVYENPLATELIFFFWSINIALIYPIMKELLKARVTRSSSHNEKYCSADVVTSPCAVYSTPRSYPASNLLNIAEFGH